MLMFMDVFHLNFLSSDGEVSRKFSLQYKLNLDLKICVLQASN